MARRATIDIDVADLPAIKAAIRAAYQQGVEDGRAEASGTGDTRQAEARGPCICDRIADGAAFHTARCEDNAAAFAVTRQAPADSKEQQA